MVNNSRVWFMVLFSLLGIILIANRWKSAQINPKETARIDKSPHSLEMNSHSKKSPVLSSSIRYLKNPSPVHSSLVY
ncbi:MAG: hypothetical protein O3B82_00460 [Bacteroidetes bacterium]|nr:hypothetical protein [Bacteroidota bacterium]